MIEIKKLDYFRLVQEGNALPSPLGDLTGHAIATHSYLIMSIFNKLNEVIDNLNKLNSKENNNENN